MSAGLLHYRAWRGEFRSPASTIWPIARVALVMMFRRKLFWVLYALGLMIFLLFFFGQYLLTWVESQASEASVPVLGLRESPARILNFLRNQLKLDGEKPDMYQRLFWYQGYIVMVILALAGSLVVGNDIQHGSLPFYLSKPLSRWHYLLGKALAIGVFINLMTTLPALILFVQYGLLTQWSFFWDHLSLAGGILAYGLVLTVSLSLLLLATATWLRKTVPMIMVWTIVFIFLALMQAALVDQLGQDPRWRLIDLWNNAYLVGSHLLGMTADKIRPSPQPAWQEAALILGGVAALCLTYLVLRIRAVEIVR